MITAERLAEIEATPREAWILKAEAKELVNAYRGSVNKDIRIAMKDARIAMLEAELAELKGEKWARRDSVTYTY